MGSKFLKISLILAGVFFAVGAFFFTQSGRSFMIESNQASIINNTSTASTTPISQAEPQEKTANNLSPISGLGCPNYNRRPVAVMLAGDVIVRPLSGISFADLVVEMPVITDSITRLMAVYVCSDPEEIGSIRSARHDFITLAQGFDAIYSHWGGSHFALDKLNKGVIDNIDALTNPYQAYWRKEGILPPHNGFSSMERLSRAAGKLGYRLENQFEGYLHDDSAPSQTKDGVLEIGFPGPYKVKYRYNAKTNSYLRFRGGTPEIDKLIGRQVEAKNVVVMRAESRQIEGQYNDVAVEGRGKAAIYKNGEEIVGYWEKDKSDPKSKLYFFNSDGEIKFTSGQIWIEVVEPGQEVKWETQP
ncbi:hypothetical protein A2W39_02995 [Candidatus Azambacteria bacterium RIFCSPHIGHO2_01_46_10]|uniref:PT repeat-containing protein n=3 Tax=Candidatus Azamiibacteriota TaxID=1752741 RepID=A0A1F5C7T0_9BACT|nr:MAG: hypothetical protein A2W60_00345 [Candidatus Azambacteria bacterium RIFCSPHIGHO2_02_46_12]OGD36014.1 MAG: hypothetical protein A2W39_02995 [Candidatus Azambacteria bacterium RIFCSPHIGHO2_01_46_10]OGD38905.1 MAG: hypothetical protein A3A25_00445 [Candidatus Azambacteria bacterium RIFCSPLOWO2_01_FULL_46_26]